MRVRLGCQPLTWGDDFTTAVREIAEIGFTGVEPWVVNYLDRMGELKALLEERGLIATGTYVACRFHETEQTESEIRRAVDLAARLPEIGCERIILASTGRITEGLHPEEVYERFADGCNEVARQVAEKHHVQTVVHNHAWTLIESPEEIDLLCRLTDPELVFMAFDTAQMAYGGGDPTEIFQRHIARVKYVHIKDMNAELSQYPTIAEKNARKPEHVFAELGTGAIGDAGLNAVLNVLREADYEGWITSELDSTPRTPKEGNQHNYDWLMNSILPEELER